MGSYRCGVVQVWGRTGVEVVELGVVELWGSSNYGDVQVLGTYRCLQMGGWCLDTGEGSGGMGGSRRQGVGAATQMGGVGWQ